MSQRTIALIAIVALAAIYVTIVPAPKPKKVAPPVAAQTK